MNRRSASTARLKRVARVGSGVKMKVSSHHAPGAGEAQKLPSFIQPLVELESLVPGHWYVNILATYPEYRGQGIGMALLAHADAVGHASSLGGLARVVSSQNESARRLYVKSGYRETARRPQTAIPGVEGGEWLLLTRQRFIGLI